MKLLVVFAHPEERSFSKSLLNDYVKHLEANGHEVKVSDLYRQNFKPVLDRNDFRNLEKDARLRVTAASKSAFKAKMLTQDILDEMDKLAWADSVVFHYPLWWMSMPAIMKGWFDRVYASGYAYSVGEYNDTHFGDRYGEGVFTGKKAMVITSAGSSSTHFSDRGINGNMNDVLYTVNHGMLYYPGFQVLPPIVIYRADRVSEDGYKEALNEIIERFDNFDTVKPIHYRKQNFGDYEIPSLRLKEGLEQPGETGYDIHIIKD